jgi:hypothetical protein
MKSITTAIFALTSLTSVQAAVDAFYSGVYLGMPIDDCIAYYLSGDPPIAERGHVTWDDPHAPPGQILVDFRTGKSLHPEKRSSEEVVERRVQVIYRESDRIIVSVAYYNIGGDHFENADLKELLDLNRGRGASRLVSHLYGKYSDGELFEVTTAEQYKLENAKR